MVSDGAENVLLQLGEILRIPAALQMDDKNVNKYAIHTLRNITVSVDVVKAIVGQNVLAWVVATAEKLSEVTTVVCDATKVLRNVALLPEGRAEIANTESAMPFLAKMVLEEDVETSRHALRCICVIINDRMCDLLP